VCVCVGGEGERECEGREGNKSRENKDWIKGRDRSYPEKLRVGDLKSTECLL
jgi:hypothetical protein